MSKREDMGVVLAKVEALLVEVVEEIAPNVTTESRQPSQRCLHSERRRYGLIEVKLGGESLIAVGRSKLRRLAEEIDTKRMKEPSFRMIIVAEGDYAYEETDGTLICPIGCLRP